MKNRPPANQQLTTPTDKHRLTEAEGNTGEGGVITEAPRGLLHHFYAVNRRGVVEKANIVTPTAHNFMMIERDLRGMTEAIADRPMKEIRRSCEMLVRAYDPCFSCSVH